MTRRALLAVALAALAASAGCGSLPSLDGGDTTASPPDEDVAAAFDDLDTLTATQVSRMTSGNTTNTTRTRTTISFGDPLQQFTRVLAPDDRAGNVQAVNETRVVIYDAAENNVTRIQRTERAPGDRGEYYASLVAAARNNSTVAPPTQGVSPLPVVPAAPSADATPTAAIDGFEVTYLGTDEVAGRTTHGFRLTPASDAALDITRVVWLDSEYYYPLRTNYTTSFGGETYRVESHLENVTFNADVPESRFDWRPPADATVRDLNMSTERYDSRAALRDASPLSLPSPDLPEGYAFENGRTYEGNYSQLSLVYETEDGARLTVSKINAPAENRSRSGVYAEGENVTVAGQDAVFLRTPQSALVSWRCDGVQYSVTADGLDRETILDVAASVACE